MTLLLLIEPLELCSPNYGYMVATSRDRSRSAELSPSVWHWSINIQNNRFNSVTLSSFIHVKNSWWDVCWLTSDEITPFFTLHLFQFKTSPNHHHILICEVIKGDLICQFIFKFSKRSFLPVLYTGLMFASFYYFTVFMLMSFCFSICHHHQLFIFSSKAYELKLRL